MTPQASRTGNSLFRFALKTSLFDPVLATFSPRLSGKVKSYTVKEIVMKLGKLLLARFGLFSRKIDLPDPFSLRLDRINMRENRRQVRQALFRAFALPLGA
jgi:hypothetical protein